MIAAIAGAVVHKVSLVAISAAVGVDASGAIMFAGGADSARDEG